MALPTCPLGAEGLIVSVQGLGCMGMSSVYGRGGDDESIATIHLALDRVSRCWTRPTPTASVTTRSSSAGPSPAAATR